MEKHIIRTNYLEKLERFREKNLIKVLTGIRRCGKSVLMEQFQERLKKGGIKNEQIISLNFEKLENEELLDYKKLHDYISGRLYKKGWSYVFLDEIQMVNEFQKTINSLRTKEQIDMYITGSNSSLLSGELATLLTGRCIPIHVMPLSFKEFLSANLSREEYGTKNGLLKDKLKEYMLYGSFPQTLDLKGRKDIYDYLDSVYSTIIRKDILARGKTIQEGILTGIAKFIFHNIGSETSSVNIANTLKSNKREVSYNTVEKYLGLLKDSFVIYEANRYDVKGKQHLKQNAKYYAVDTGMRNMLLSNKETDIGHILENIVYTELIRRDYKVCVGKVDNREIDFVAENENGIEYYQVAATVLDEQTRERELEPLNKIKDHSPKFLITLDDYSGGTTYNGIRLINAIEFLSGNY